MFPEVAEAENDEEFFCCQTAPSQSVESGLANDEVDKAFSRQSWNRWNIPF